MRTVTEGEAREAKSDDEVASVALAGVEQWVILCAEKIRSRKLARCQQSEWEVVWLNVATMSTHRVLQRVQSNSIRGVTRSVRYPETAGSTAVVKSMVADPRLPVGGKPSLVVKSFHSYIWPMLQGEAVKHLVKVERYFRVQGVSCYVGGRRYSSENDNIKPFIVMQSVGVGLDLYALLGDEKYKSRLLGSEEAQKSLLLAIIRLLAFLDFFHAKEGRSLIDIKAENILPILDGHGHIVQLVIVDLDESFGDSFTYTPDAMLTVSDVKHVEGVRSGAERFVDFHGVAVAIIDILHKAGRNRYVKRVDSSARELLSRYGQHKYEWQPAESDNTLVKLCHWLSQTEGNHIDIPAGLMATFGDGEGMPYCDAFVRERESLEGRMRGIDQLNARRLAGEFGVFAPQQTLLTALNSVEVKDASRCAII